MVDNKMDISLKSCTIPIINFNPEIPIDSMIRELKRKLSSSNMSIILEGPMGSGKTAQLLQFVNENKESCFSYFLTDNYWFLRQNAFLTSMCNQMISYLGTTPISANSSYDGLQIDIEKLKTIFDNLIQKVIDKVREDKNPCYFVVDGLEKAFSGNKGERIIDLFPLPMNHRGLFFLGSIQSTSASLLEFKYQSVEPHSFSIVETTKYLEDLHLHQEQIINIQKFSGGMPGFLMVVKNLLSSNQASIDQLINEPAKFDILVDFQWKNAVSGISENHKLVFGLLAQSLVPLNSTTIAEILELDKDEVDQYIAKSAILKRTNDDCYVFYPDSHRRIAQDHLRGIKDRIISKLTKYYENQPENRASSFLLPEYYKLGENYDALEKLITPQYLVDITLDNNSLSLAQRNLSNSVELAQKRNDLSTLKYGLANSQLRTLENQFAGISEVRALISLKLFDNALKLAVSSNIITTRIRLLAQVYLAMEKDGITVPTQSITEISSLVDKIDITQLDPETLLDIATEIFPLVPDVAINLVDKAKFIETDKSPMELFALMASVKSEDHECENLVDKIINQELHDFALINSPWLTKLPAEDVIQKSSEVNSTKAKEYLLRHWCLQNKNNKSIHIVLNTMLDILVADTNYKIPLRNLRQFSEALRYCDKDSREILIKRFDLPIFASLQSPIQERVRLELNLAEAFYEIDSYEAIARLKRTYSYILTDQIDGDVFCYCLSRLLGSLKIIDSKNEQFEIKEITKKLEDAFLLLRESSADQLEVTRPTLRSLAKVEPELALTFSDLLNTVDRRDLGVQEVLTSYIRQDATEICAEIITMGLEKICNQRICEQTILKLISISKDIDQLSDSSLMEYFLEKVESVEDGLTRSKCFAYLLSSIETTNEQCKEISSRLLTSWEKVDVIWMRVELGFDLASIIANLHPDLAQDLFERAKALRNASSLDNQPIGVMYVETLRIAARISGNLDLKTVDGKENWEKLIRYAEFTPSKLLQILLFGQLAMARMLVGDKKAFDELIQDKVLPGLQSTDMSDLKGSVISDLALPIFEFSPEEARAWVSKLPYSLQNVTWLKTALRVLSRSNICDIVEEDRPNFQVDLQIANKVLQILEFIDRDQEIAQITKTLCHSIANDNCRLSEVAKLDVLLRLENVVDKKLPDKMNITHEGYKVLVDGDIEFSRRKSAKKTKTKITHNHAKIIKAAKGIENIADQVLVLAELGLKFREIERDLANQLLDDAFVLLPKITNVSDRIDRLETIADNFSVLHNTSKAQEAINLGREIAKSLEGIERDKVLSSLIQTANQIDKKIAAEITEKIEDFTTQYSMDIAINSLDLSKAPQKLLLKNIRLMDDETLKAAAIKMNRSLISGRSVSCTKETIVKWLSATQDVAFDSSKEIITWAVESVIRSAATSEVGKLSANIISYLLSDCDLLVLLGSHLSSLSVIPDNLVENIQCLSTNKELIKVGERKKAIDFISSWLKGNAKKFVKICDPYFDNSQLWILQLVPNGLDVKILTTEKSIISQRNKIKPMDREEIKILKKSIQTDFISKWAEISNQDPPDTLIVIHGAIFNDGNDTFHDRYIITEGGGLSIGTSLNGFGNKEFFITTLSSIDAHVVEEKYINPKLKIEEFFSSIIYFELNQ